MSSTSTPSPIPFLLLGLVTGSALLYVSYWVWPPAQRRNNNNSRNGRRVAGRRQNNTNRGTTASSSGGQGLRRSNATRRAAPHRQPAQSTGARPEDNRHYHSEGTSSDEETYRGRGHGNDTDDDGDTSDHEYSALVDEDGYERLRMDEMGDNKHDGLQLMNLLYAIAEDQAVKGGITCNNCRTVPIRGLRYKCANCQDYDLCEGCEAAEVHIKSHVFMKIRIPIPPLANSRTKKLPPFYPGIPQGNTSTPDHMLQDLLQKTHFDNVELDAMYSQYLSLSTLDQDGGGITRLTFEQALGPLGLEKNLITDRIFRFFDQDDDETISFKEMACGLSVLCKGNFEEKIAFAFQGYDLDGDGYISREELHEMFKAYFYLSMELIRDVVKTMETDLINNFEYQPGMPISATFTAPIPREIGVRNTNAANGQHQGGQNGSMDETTQSRDQTSLLAEWPTSPDEDGSSASPTNSFSSSDSPGISSSREERVNEVDQQHPLSRHRPTDMETLPSGAYGLVGSDAFARDSDDDSEDADDEEGDASSLPGDNKQDNDFENDPPVLVASISTSQEPTSDLSEAEDSGVDNSGWSASDAHSPSLNSANSQDSHAATRSNSQPTVASRSSTAASTANTAASQLSQPASSNVADQGSSSSSSRPRKDQPLPATTSSPHPRTVSVSNINLAWDRPHYRSTSSSFGHNSHSATPASAPAPESGYDLSQNASGLFSSAVYDMSNSTEVSRSTDGQVRRPSLGTPYQSYASSSSAPAGSYANPSFFSSTFPVMESISQDAIQEMVEKTFSAIPNPSKPGFITLEEFRAYVLTDAGILGWFDALGSIF
ncbi:hypothetical protein BGZ95_005809 [Linnemannia exigua]|uniref:EF-hand n=1 Tax=Linnemannia exigua TaxID=604196 RepID=A0AAD4DGW7_9FUNG|nr:hypothetical protein BGZ95_005809 [Linnemannia exigua]